MPDKLTDAEVKKALECCSSGSYGCENGCPLDKECDSPIRGGEKIMKSALDLINRQSSRIEKLEKVEHFADKTIESLKAEVERLKKVEERHMRLYHLLLDPVIVANGKNGELRPIKRTSRQDVYHTLLRAQEIMKIPHRWFPWKRDGDNK